MNSQMKNQIIPYIVVLLVGIIFLLVSNLGLNSMPDKDKMIQITGVITDIEVERSGDSDTHTVYVEYEIDGQVYEERLGYYTSSFRVGSEITLYYEEGKPEKVYAEGEEGFLKMFKILGIVIIIGGVLGMGYSVYKIRKTI